MSTYDDLTFAPMLITEVFGSMTAARGWFDLSKAMTEGEAECPYIARSGGDNGIGSFLPHQGVEPPNEGNAITIGVSTSTVFYQPVPFYSSKEIQVLRHRQLNQYNGMLLVAILREQMSKFQWGNGASLVRLKATRIMVPVTEVGPGEVGVDWDGMTTLGRELFANARAHARTPRSAEVAPEEPLPELHFEPMLIPDVFESMTASQAWYDKAALLPGGEASYPFVSRTKASNGVDGFSSKQPKAPEPGNAITIGLDTQTVAYQPVPFYTSQNIQVLRHSCLTLDTAMVLVACIREQMGKFSWGGNGATLGRLKATRIMVPTTNSEHGEQVVVDWQGMTTYAQVLRARAESEAAPAMLGERLG